MLKYERKNIKKIKKNVMFIFYMEVIWFNMFQKYFKVIKKGRNLNFFLDMLNCEIF